MWGAGDKLELFETLLEDDSSIGNLIVQKTVVDATSRRELTKEELSCGRSRLKDGVYNVMDGLQRSTTILQIQPGAHGLYPGTAVARAVARGSSIPPDCTSVYST